MLNAADLPVKQVTLYKHGIGFFEREGTIPAGEEARLDFKNNEMNDVLKSLIVSASGGTGISAVRYDSNATLDQQLGKFPFSIGNGEMFSSFLDRLKGAHLEIKLGDRTLAGAILGARTLAAGSSEQPKSATEQITLLLDSGDVANFDLAAIGSMHLQDARLQQQLKDYLETLAQAKGKDKRSIYLSSAAGNRNLRLSYISPTAIWKSSYRLSLNADKPVIEGWATVDNTSDEDWTNVRLSVVSGRPISFISSLDTPRYGNRQIAELPEDRAAGPMVYAGGVTDVVVDGENLPDVPSAALTVGGQMGGSGSGTGRGRFSRADGTHVGSGLSQSAPAQPNEPRRLEEYAQLQSSVKGATGATLGELFEYHFDGPVTIRKNQSAMLPFLQSTIGAHKLLIYQGNDGEHPVNAVEVSNATGKTLDGGPITVFDAGAYAGEALVETLKTGDKRLIGYAVDYGTRIASSYGQVDNIVREISARDGVVEVRVAEQLEHTYTIKNVDAKAKTIVIEQALMNEYTLLAPSPAERTAAAYRFEVRVPASASQSLIVKQEHLISQQTIVSTATPESLLIFVQNKKLSDSGRRQLQAIVDLKSQINESQAALEAATTKIHDLTEEQTRFRQNINSLNQVKGQEDQVRQYSSQLSNNELNMAKLRDQRDAAAQQKLNLDGQLRQAISKLNF